MTPASNNSQDPNPRVQRLMKRVGQASRNETEAACQALRQRPDHHPVWDYFLDLLSRGPGRVEGPSITHLCNQAPFELFHAAGLRPVRLASGCHAAGRLAVSGFPVLMCPMLRATMGNMRLTPPSAGAPMVVPCTCDWVVKFPEMAVAPEETTWFMELPRLRQNESSTERWTEAVFSLIRRLETHTGQRLKRKQLLNSINTFMQAWQVLGRLIRLRRQGAVAGPWFTAVANAFMLDPVETWTVQVEKAVAHIEAQKQTRAPGNRTIFLAGAPIVFPNFKLLTLIEAAGLEVVADDICTSERIWPGALSRNDTSFDGLVRALAQRYHQGCICPTFGDNDRRINSILHTLDQHPVGGVVFHVLKGCHPFDIESFTLERELAARGIKFLKIETDYVEEDSQNILTRLEAFSQI